MTDNAATAPSTGGVTLRFLELCQFRRLGKVQVDIDEKTTILVGANNSGKTSVLTALRHFLSDSAPFGAFDISLSQWPKLRALGKQWEVLAEDPASAAGTDKTDWAAQLTTLLSAMPTLDLWFNAQEGMYHVVAPFLSKFNWQGGAVGVRLRLEPASDVASLQELAWSYHRARLPVREMSKDSLAWPIDLLDYWLRESSKMGQVNAYKLDTENNPLAGKATYTTQLLQADAQPIERRHLTKLIRVDFVPAQRGLGAEEAASRSASGSHRVGMSPTSCCSSHAGT